MTDVSLARFLVFLVALLLPPHLRKGDGQVDISSGLRDGVPSRARRRVQYSTAAPLLKLLPCSSCSAGAWVAIARLRGDCMGAASRLLSC